MDSGYKKKLLAITPLFGRSGSEIALLNLMESLKEDFQITIFTPRQDPELKQELGQEIRLIFPEKKHEQAFFQRIRYKIKDFCATRNDLDKLIGDQEYDIVLLNTFLSLKYFPLVREKGKKILLYIHETELMLQGIEQESFNKVISEADLILCCSNYVKRVLLICGRKEAIEVLHPSLDFTSFHIPVATTTIRNSLGFTNGDFVWGMVGALTGNKNPAMFVEAAQQLLKRNDQAKFLWIGARGNDVYRQYLEKLISSAGLEGKIQFIEKKTTDYYQYINIMDGFVLTSISESFSLAALEAACFNKPVVSFPCGGILESVPEKLRWITNDFTVGELVALMEFVMKNPLREIGLEDVQKMLEKDRSRAGLNFRVRVEQICPFPSRQKLQIE